MDQAIDKPVDPVQEIYKITLDTPLIQEPVVSVDPTYIGFSGHFDMGTKKLVFEHVECSINVGKDNKSVVFMGNEQLGSLNSETFQTQIETLIKSRISVN